MFYKVIYLKDANKATLQNILIKFFYQIFFFPSWFQSLILTNKLWTGFIIYNDIISFDNQWNRTSKNTAKADIGFNVIHYKQNQNKNKESLAIGKVLSNVIQSQLHTDMRMHFAL